MERLNRLQPPILPALMCLRTSDGKPAMHEGERKGPLFGHLPIPQETIADQMPLVAHLAKTSMNYTTCKGAVLA
jgi:hypothetical protein